MASMIKFTQKTSISLVTTQYELTKYLALVIASFFYIILLAVVRIKPFLHEWQATQEGE